LRLDSSLARRVSGRIRRLAKAAATPGAQPEEPRILGAEEIGDIPREALERACRHFASPVYLGGGVGLCRILTRYKFFVPTDDVGFGANVLLDGYWESWLTRFMARTVRRGGTVVDVGANFGYYSMLLADLVGPEGRLYAIEPNPATARLLRRSLSLNGFSARTIVCEVAAGASDDMTASLYVPAGEPKNAAIVAAAPAGGQGGETHQVAVRTLDSLLRVEQRIDFVKIDAEGAEEAIIAGMTRLCAFRPPPMVLEFNAARYADPAGFLAELLAIYGSLAYVGYDGEAVSIAPERVLEENFGEDWLLYLRRA
jgi:FkbM family methyltransferase